MPMPWAAAAPTASPSLSNEEGYGRVPLDDHSEEVLAIEPDSDDGIPQNKKVEIARLEVEIELSQLQEATFQKQLDGLNTFWGTKAQGLENDIAECLAGRNSLQERIVSFEHPSQETHAPPGLKRYPYLNFVRQTRFMAMCSAVVLVNIVTMFMEMLHPHYKEQFWLLDQVVLVFYITELTLKALIFEKELLRGPCLVVWWNWLDLIIVIVGILDQWMQPIYVLAAGDSDSGHSQAVQIIKMLRIARLARILKTVRAFMESDLSWTEGKRFQLFIMGTIAANSLIMSFESDYPDFWGWWYVEQTLLGIFSFELLVRLRFSGCRFFYHPTDILWNWLDFTIVTGGAVDEWLMPFINMVQSLMGMKAAEMFDVGELMTTLRMARLLRILRLVRLVKNIPPLFTLIVGIAQAMQGMAWVLVLTAVFLYAFALLSVRLVGHGMLFGGQAPEDVAAIFPSVPQSMFVLFKVMNGDTEPVEPLFTALPLSKLFFVLYMVVSSWAILSILTAVVSDNMINATDQHRTEIDSEESSNEERITRQWLGELFMTADKDGNGDLGWEEFNTMIADEATLNQLMNLTKLQKADLIQVYSLLKTTDRVLRDDLIDALRTEKRSPTERSVLRLEKRLITLQNAFDLQLGNLKPSVSGSPQPTNAPFDAKSVESMLEPLFKKIDERLDRKYGPSVDRKYLLESSALDSSTLGKNVSTIDASTLPLPRFQSSQSSTIATLDGSTMGRPDVSTIESSLARIEEQMDISTRLLDRSRVECTIMSGLAKIEQQNMDIKKGLFDNLDADCTLKSLLSKIENQNNDMKKTMFEGSDSNATIKTSLSKIEERLDSSRELRHLEISTELLSLESVIQKIGTQLNSIISTPDASGASAGQKATQTPFIGEPEVRTFIGQPVVGQGEVHGTLYSQQAGDVTRPVVERERSARSEAQYSDVS